MTFFQGRMHFTFLNFQKSPFINPREANLTDFAKIALVAPKIVQFKKFKNTRVEEGLGFLLNIIPAFLVDFLLYCSYLKITLKSFGGPGIKKL